jgi:hypothetical protein
MPVHRLLSAQPRTAHQLARPVAEIPFGRGFDRSPMRATKWALVISLVFAGISCNAEQAKSEVLIKNDGGGDIRQYIAKYLYLQLRGERVVIDGDCLSACTLALGLLAKDRRCFTNEARLGFHAAWIESGKPGIRDSLGTGVFWLVYPAEIRRWISRHGGLTSSVIYLEGKELAAMYPPCRRPNRSLKKLRD